MILDLCYVILQVKMEGESMKIREFLAKLLGKSVPENENTEDINKAVKRKYVNRGLIKNNQEIINEADERREEKYNEEDERSK